MCPLVMCYVMSFLQKERKFVKLSVKFVLLKKAVGRLIFGSLKVNEGKCLLFEHIANCANFSWEGDTEEEIDDDHAWERIELNQRKTRNFLTFKQSLLSSQTIWAF